MQADTEPGQVVAGRYRLADRIGQGAMGTVWRASDLVLDREVAIKQVHLPVLMTSHERDVLRERTLREARVSAKLNHPGIVTVHDVIEADGSPWIVMELITARSLDQVLAEDGPLPPERAATVGALLLAALASAHGAGVVHRDVKPANVLLTRGGQPVLTDFGIATLAGDPGLTQTGMVMGTPGFCAPERIRGEPASPASDLWSLGATLYAAVEGHGPFDAAGTPMAVAASIVHGQAPHPRSAGQLGPVINALLDKDPCRRPDATSAAQMLTDAARPVACPEPAGHEPAGHEPAGQDAGTWPLGFLADSVPVAPPPPPPPPAANPSAVVLPLGAPEIMPPPGAGTGHEDWRPVRGRTPPRARRRALRYAFGAVAVIGAGLLAGALIAVAVRASHNTSGLAGRQAATGLPPGYRWYGQPTRAGTASAGFSMAVPDGWEMKQRGSVTYVRDPASGATITLTRVPAGAGGPLRQVHRLEGLYPGYHRIAILPFFWHGTPAVAWRFAYLGQGGGAMEGLGVMTSMPAPAGDQRVELLVTAPAARWPASRSAFEEALRTLH